MKKNFSNEWDKAFKEKEERSEITVLAAPVSNCETLNIFCALLNLFVLKSPEMKELGYMISQSFGVPW